MNKKNWLFLFLACTFTLTFFNACKKSDDTTDTTDTGPTEWVKSTVFTGDPRSNAAYFQIDNVGYIATGILKNNTRIKDAWSFSNKQWSQIAPFPGTARHGAVGFSIGKKGYVGLGHDGTAALSDIYVYDQVAKTWSTAAIKPFPGEARYGAVAFTLGNFAYVGLGSTTGGKNLSDFYKYDPVANDWSPVPAQFTSKRVNAFAFVINGKAYVGGGIDNSQFPDDFYSFDGTTWKQLNPIKRADSDYTYDLTRESAATFAIGNFGYVVGGKKNSVLGNVWKYDPATDSWTDKHQVFQGSYREGATAFSIDNKGYVATGMNGTSKYDDNWEFTPVR